MTAGAAIDVPAVANSSGTLATLMTAATPLAVVVVDG